MAEKINFDYIKQKQFKGYLWLSDKEKPRVFEKLSNIDVNCYVKDNFIIEGQLCNDTESISIKTIDGETLVYKFEMPSEFDKNDVISFVANSKMGISKKLKFLRIWKENEEKFPVLEFQNMIFIGFE